MRYPNRLLLACAALAAGEFAASRAATLVELWPFVALVALAVALVGYGWAVRGWPVAAWALVGVAVFYCATSERERAFRETPWMREARVRRAAADDGADGSARAAARREFLRRAAIGIEEDQEVVQLNREIALLRYFAGHVGEAVSRDFLLTRFWGAETCAQENTLSVYLHALREKLGDDGARLKSVRGVGYAYVSR